MNQEQMELRKKITLITIQTEFALRDFTLKMFNHFCDKDVRWQDKIPKDTFNEVLKEVKKNKGLECKEVASEELYFFLENTSVGRLVNILVSNYKYIKDMIELKKSELEKILFKFNKIRNIMYGHTEREIPDSGLFEVIESAFIVTDINPKHFEDLKKNLEDICKELPLELVKRPKSKNSSIPQFNNDNIGFYGRHNETKKLVEKLKSFQRKITIFGNGGMGKTSLVQVALNDCIEKNELNFDYYVWCSAKKDYLSEEGIVPLISSLNTLDDILDEVLSIFYNEKCDKIKESISDKEEKKDLVKNILDEFNVLLVIDNVETISDHKEIMDFLNEVSDTCKGLKLLYTCRNYITNGGERIEIKGLDINAAVNYFNRICELNEIDQNFNETQKRKLIEMVENKPLAIKWCLSTRNAKSSKPFHEIFADARSGESDLVKFCFEDIINQLREKNEKYLNVLYYLATSSCEVRIEQIIFMIDEINRDDLKNILDDLSDYSLIEYKDNSKKVIAIHELAREYMDKNSNIRAEIKKQMNKNRELYEACIKEYNKLLEEHQEFVNIPIKDESEKPYVLRAINKYNMYANKQNLGDEEINKVIADLTDIYNTCNNSEILIILARLQSKFGLLQNIIKNEVLYFKDNPRVWKVYGDIERKIAKDNISVGSALDTMMSSPLKSAIDKYTKSLDLEKNAYVYHALGDCYQMNRSSNNDDYLDLDKAIDCFEESLKINILSGNEHKGKVIIYQSLAETYRRKACVYKDNFNSWEANIKQSIDYLNDAFNQGLNDRKLHETKNKIYSDAIITYFKNGKYEDSLNYINKIINNYVKVNILFKISYETIIRAFLTKARIMFSKGDIKSSHENYEMALAVLIRNRGNIKEKNNIKNERNKCKEIINYIETIEEGKILEKYIKGDSHEGYLIYCKKCNQQHFAHKSSFSSILSVEDINRLMKEDIKVNFSCLKSYKEALNPGGRRNAYNIEVTKEKFIGEIPIDILKVNNKSNILNEILKKSSCVGTINSLHHSKKFGSIKDNSTGEIIFFHISDIKNKISYKEKGCLLSDIIGTPRKVTFDLYENTSADKNKNTNARNVIIEEK